MGDAIKTAFASSSISPLILGWLIADFAGGTGISYRFSPHRAGLVLPLMQGAGIDPALMVLSVGAGSLAASHVNDSGFGCLRVF